MILGPVGNPDRFHSCPETAIKSRADHARDVEAARQERHAALERKRRSDEIVRKMAAREKTKRAVCATDKEVKTFVKDWDARLKEERRAECLFHLVLPVAALIDSLWRFVDRLASRR